MKDFKVDIKDLILVSVDKKFKDYAEKPLGFYLEEEFIPRGKVKELAILNKDRTRFILVSEFEEHKIRAVSNFVQINSVGEYDFEYPDICTMPSPAATFTLSKEEIEFGADFSVLKQKNQEYAQAQFKTFMQEWNKAKGDAAKRKVLEESREIYLDF